MWTQIHKNGTPKLTMLPTLKKKGTEFGQHLPLETPASNYFLSKKKKKKEKLRMRDSLKKSWIIFPFSQIMLITVLKNWC